MNTAGDILISVDGRHASNMLAGIKSVELRRKPLNIPSGTRVWVYSKLPQGEIQALAIVDEVISANPAAIWKAYGKQSAITKPEFDEYFAAAQTGYAIVFEEVRALAPILSLSLIREKIAHFQPPQFFKKLSESSPELALFETALACPAE